MGGGFVWSPCPIGWKGRKCEFLFKGEDKQKRPFPIVHYALPMGGGG